MAQVHASNNVSEKNPKRKVRNSINILCFLHELEFFTSIILIMMKFLFFFCKNHVDPINKHVYWQALTPLRPRVNQF